MSMKERKRGRSGVHPAAAGLRVISTLVLVLLVIVCLPLTVPKVLGYHIYSVVSGSMEPAIPTGSLLYVQGAQPEEMETGDIIAFYGSGHSATIITHRVVENRVVMGEFITKGDANQAEDLQPVPYEDFIGEAVRIVPGAGRAAEIFTTFEGKTAAGALVLMAVFLQILASLLDRGRDREDNA